MLCDGNNLIMRRIAGTGTGSRIHFVLDHASVSGYTGKEIVEE